MISTAWALFIANWVIGTILAAWACGGGIHYMMHSDEVVLQPQKIVYAALCGPLVWFFRSVGWGIDLLDYIFAGFKAWLFKPAKK
jgi:hypothetical protein